MDKSNTVVRSFVGPSIVEPANRSLRVVYGPVLVAIFFAVAINVDQSLEVIHSSYAQFEEDRNGENWIWAWIATLLRLFLLAGLPVAVVSASRIALASTGHPRIRKYTAVPSAFGALAWGAYAVALFWGMEVIVESPELCQTALGDRACLHDTTLQGLSRMVLTMIVFTVLLFVQMQIHFMVERGAHARAVGAPFLILCAIAFFIIAVFVPSAATHVGPLASTAVLLSVLAYALAGLTMLTNKLNLRIPLLFVVVWLALVTTSATVAVSIGVGAAIAAISYLLSNCFPYFRRVTTHWWEYFSGSKGLDNAEHVDGKQRRRALIRWAGLRFLVDVRSWWRSYWIRLCGLVFIASFAVYGVHRYVVQDCASLSGCNEVVLIGPIPEPFKTPSAAAAASDAAEDEIILVSAQGGGLFAAYHSAYYLARLADLAPEDAEKVFAVSGVSGGSVGAGVYWAVRASGVCEIKNRGLPPDQRTCYVDAVRDILNRDYLAPLFVTLFSRDLVDSVVPVSLFASQPIDRGAVFEAEIQRHFDNWITEAQRDVPVDELQQVWHTDGGFLDEAFTDTAKSQKPYLAFNAVNVDRGERVVLSPLFEANGGDYGLAFTEEGDLSFLQAMVASARFPLVTPPLRVSLQNRTHNVGSNVQSDFGENAASCDVAKSSYDRRTCSFPSHQLADGGYYDNSGLQTAWDIANDLLKDETRYIRIVELNSHAPSEESGVHGLLGAPISAFIGSWRSQAELSSRRVREFSEGIAKSSEKSRVDVCEVSIVIGDTMATNFTLGWFLSTQSFKEIEEKVRGALQDASVC